MLLTCSNCLHQWLTEIIDSCPNCGGRGLTDEERHKEAMDFLKELTEAYEEQEDLQ